MTIIVRCVSLYSDSAREAKQSTTVYILKVWSKCCVFCCWKGSTLFIAPPSHTRNAFIKYVLYVYKRISIEIKCVSYNTHQHRGGIEKGSRKRPKLSLYRRVYKYVLCNNSIVNNKTKKNAYPGKRKRENFFFFF